MDRRIRRRSPSNPRNVALLYGRERPEGQAEAASASVLVVGAVILLSCHSTVHHFTPLSQQFAPRSSYRQCAFPFDDDMRVVLRG
jgi:hypothetical protein